MSKGIVIKDGITYVKVFSIKPREEYTRVYKDRDGSTTKIVSKIEVWENTKHKSFD